MAIGSDEQYAAGPFKANDLIVNNQAMFSNPGMMALVAKEARKGTGGFFEIPNRERKEAPFLTAAKERVNQELGLSPAVQGGMKNFLGQSETVEDAPKKWQSSPDSPETELAYITDQEKDLLLKANLHDSLGDGMPNQGPSGIISLDGMGQEDDDSPGKKSYSSGNQGRGAGQTRQSSYDGDNAKDIPTIYQDQERREQQQDRTGTGEFNTQANIEQAIQDTDARSGISGETETTSATTEQGLVEKLEAEKAENKLRLEVLKEIPENEMTEAELAEYENLLGGQKLFEDLRRKKGEEEDDETTLDQVKKLFTGSSQEDIMKILQSGGELTDKQQVSAANFLAGNKKNKNVLTDAQEKAFSKLFNEKDLEKQITGYREGARNADYFGGGGFGAPKFLGGMFKSMTAGDEREDKSRTLAGLSKDLTSGEIAYLKANRPDLYYGDEGAAGLGGNTMNDLLELSQLDTSNKNLSSRQLQNIYAAREKLSTQKEQQDLRNNKGPQSYQGYQGPVIEKQPDEVSSMPVEEPAIDPAVGTRPFATPAAGGSQYKLPMDYRASLTRDGEYGINRDPKSIAYSGGYNQMEDMDEYLKRIGKKRKNYLDEDGNPIMTNAMGGE
mgnify:CR=1 FL=1